MVASTMVPRPDHILDVADTHGSRGMAAGLSKIVLQKECLNRKSDGQTARQSSKLSRRFALGVERQHPALALALR